MPSLLSILGDPLIVTLTLFKSGKRYFSESLFPAVYGSKNSQRMPFMDLLWASTSMFILASEFWLIVTTLARFT